MNGLPGPPEADVLSNSLTLVSFYPDKYDKNSPKARKARRLCRSDLGLARCALSDVKGPIIIQLSTYNSQRDVILSTDSVLNSGDFDRAAKVRVDGNMMSLVYTRGVEWAADLAGIPDNFTNWLREVKRRMR